MNLRSISRALAVAAVAALATAGSASADTYCVSAPSCVGTKAADVQSALSAAAGTTNVADRIEIGPGTFQSATGTFSYTGTGAANTVEIVGAGVGQTTISGAASQSSTRIVRIDGQAPAKISDLTITTASPAAGIVDLAALRIHGTAERIDVQAAHHINGVELANDSTLRDSHVTQAAVQNGVYVLSSNARVEDSTIDGAGNGYAVTVTGIGSTVTVSHSKLTGGEGINAINGGAAKIDNSLVHASSTGLSAFSHSSVDATNVTVIGSGLNNDGVKSAEAAGDTTEVTLENSAVAGFTRSLSRWNNGGAAGGQALLTVHNSAYDHSAVSQTGPGGIDQSDHNLDVVDPGFVNFVAADYHLRSDSPLRDAGGASVFGPLAATDLDGLPRSVGAPDIGAFEFQPAPAPDPGPGTGGGGVPAGGPGPVPADAAPAITAATLTNKRFAVARARTAVAAGVKRGTAFRLTLSEAAKVKIDIRGKGGRKAGALNRSARAGANRFAFSGRVGSRALKPGRYTATVTATDASGKRSAPRKLTFTVVKG